MPTPPHIVVHFRGLNGGGAPTVVRNQIACLLEAGYRVTFLSLERPSHQHFKHPLFRHVQLKLSSSAGFAGRVLSLYRQLCRLDIDILIAHSVRLGAYIGMAGLPLSFKLVIVDHAHPPTSWSLLSPSQRLALKHFLPRARLICVSQGAAADLQARIKRPVSYIYNFAPSQSEVQRCSAQIKRKVIAGIGRFSPEKQFDYLIAAFAEVAVKHPDWELHLYGDGSERLALELAAQSCGHDSQIKLFGWTTDPLRILSEASIVAQTSKFEGFGLALVEAMAVGTSVVSFDCPYGPGEIIRDEVDGLLVRNQSVSAMAAALDRLMSSETLRQRLSRAAQDIVTKFPLTAHRDAWLSEIRKLHQ